MALLYVTFKLNTSREWVVEKLTETGLKEVGVMLKTKEGDHVFLPMVNLKHRNALIEVPDNEEVRYKQVIRMLSPQVVSVLRA